MHFVFGFSFCIFFFFWFFSSDEFVFLFCSICVWNFQLVHYEFTTNCWPLWSSLATLIVIRYIYVWMCILNERISYVNRYGRSRSVIMHTNDLIWCEFITYTHTMQIESSMQKIHNYNNWNEKPLKNFPCETERDPHSLAQALNAFVFCSFPLFVCMCLRNCRVKWHRGSFNWNIFNKIRHLFRANCANTEIPMTKTVHCSSWELGNDTVTR